ncbi:MAG: hypothetical protein R3281_18420 [Balneolaceae bacterium]|nr:hypothetical protein [Balneolaceae bacterium]
MKSVTTIFHTIILLTVASLLAMLTACSNPAGSDEDHEEHTEPFGLELVLNGQTMIEYFEGEISGQIQVTEGEETALISVHFLNDEREEIHAEDLDDEYRLEWTIENENIFEIEQHDEDGRWSFHIHGKTAGTSRVQFRLMHGDHADFETPAVNQDGAITVTVQPVQS